MFPNLLSSPLRFTKILGGISKSLSIANKAIPLINQARPMVNSATKIISNINQPKKNNNPRNELKTSEKKVIVNAPTFFQ